MRSQFKIFIIIGAISLFFACASTPVPIYHTIQIESFEGGTVYPDNSIDILDGDSLELVFTPDNGFVIDDVIIDGKSIGSVNTYSFENIHNAHYAEIIFRDEVVCLVLSVGGVKGLAHIGAIQALKKMDINPDFVYGNSMGALIGSLYVSGPDENIQDRYTTLMLKYEKKTKEVATSAGISGGLLGGLAMLFVSGGTLGWETLAGSLAAGTLSAGAVDKIDNKRLRDVLNNYLNNLMFQDLILPFGTSYQVQQDQGLEFIFVNKGDVSLAVGNSINNPYIFQNTSLKEIDPGADRMAAIPVQDAYNMFNPDRIIVINVTAISPVYTEIVDCEVVEIKIPYGEVGFSAFEGKGEEYTKVIQLGYNTVFNFFK